MQDQARKKIAWLFPSVLCMGDDKECIHCMVHEEKCNWRRKIVFCSQHVCDLQAGGSSCWLLNWA